MGPRSLRTAGGALALAVLLAMPGAATGASRSQPVAVADAVGAALRSVAAQAAVLGLGDADIAAVRVTDAYRSSHTGVTHVYLLQGHDGRDVAGATMTVNVGPDGEPVHAASRFLRDLAAVASGVARVAPGEAVRAAAAELGGVAGDTRPTLRYQALKDGTARLVWNVDVDDPAGLHDWNASVDAETGRVLTVHDYVDQDSPDSAGVSVARQTVEDGASYRVFAQPLESPNDGPRTLVEQPADAVASPLGWHDTDGQPGPEFTTTRGNNVHAYGDTINDDAPDVVTDPDGGADLAFDYPFEQQSLPPQFAQAAITNLFYWNNVIHDVFYGYGFDEVAGNFQVNNYGRGGLGGDDVRAQAQDGSGTSNANFATPADGSRPRMQMYLFPPPTSEVLGSPTQAHFRDGDFESGIITHEYGHGISNRLTGGPSEVGCLSNQEQMGEGWSDFFSVALTTLPTETRDSDRGMGSYVLAQPNGRASKGVRPAPYSTSLERNPATYDTIKSAAVPHGVGYVWASMLFEVYWNLIDAHGFNADLYADWDTGGNNLALQLVLDGMKMQPCSPGFVDGRDAILAADTVLTGAANHCLIWRGFAKRGLGVGADQGDSGSRGDGIQSFELPPACV
jgi:extracellular elastinolytic metalloproteinase